MAFGRLWAGRIYGTNTGNVFVKLEGEDTSLRGILRVAEPNAGVVVYNVEGTFEGTKLAAAGRPANVPDGTGAGDLKIAGDLDQRGEVRGEWETTLGTGGTFILFPHDPASLPVGDAAEADQLHTKRHTFGPIEVSKEDLVRIGEKMQGDFPGRKVVVTISAATEQIRLLDDFRATDSPYSKAQIAKLYVQQPEAGGVNRVLAVEFGPATNSVMAQSSDEAWALGIVERLKRDIHPFERSSALNIRRIGFGVNQLLIFWAIIFLVEIPNLWWRVAFFASVLAITYANNQFHNKFVPMATIQLGAQRPSIWSRLGPSFWSWAAALVSSVAVSIISAYAKGWLRLP